MSRKSAFAEGFAYALARCSPHISRDPVLVHELWGEYQHALEGLRPPDLVPVFWAGKPQPWRTEFCNLFLVIRKNVEPPTPEPERAATGRPPQEAIRWSGGFDDGSGQSRAKSASDLKKPFKPRKPGPMKQPQTSKQSEERLPISDDE